MEQLRFTTTKPMSMMGIFTPIEKQEPPLVVPDVIGDLIESETKSNCAYIHDDAEIIAKYDIPTFIDGDMAQLDLPVDQQDILMLLPSGNYPCKAELISNKYNNNKLQYHITLKK